MSEIRDTLNCESSIANPTNIDTLLIVIEKEGKVILPPESLQDKTVFIFNSLSELNIESKCSELRNLVSDEYWPWISQYLVIKRASTELNLHDLYYQFLETLKVEELFKTVTTETIRNIKVLLRSDKGNDNYSDWLLLRNLGNWLGMLTLGRNKPILQTDLDLKSLLFEAHHKGEVELLYVVPFVARILKSCAKSKVFKPPNPWTMAIVKVMTELKQEQDLKTNLKFEIESLYKTLNINVCELKPAMYLRDTKILRKIDHQLSHPNECDNTTQSVSSSSTVRASSLNQPELKSVVVQVANPSPITQSNRLTSTSPLHPPPGFSCTDLLLTENIYLQVCITINPNIVLFKNNLGLEALARTEVERVIRGWTAPVFHTSIQTAVAATEVVVTKDRVLILGENKMRDVAHCMVTGLTASKVMLTCRDQLLGAINTHINYVLQNAMVGTTTQQEIIERAASIIAQDNIEVACVFIHKSAMEMAITEIDKKLAAKFELWKITSQEQRQYCDTAALSLQMERVPEEISESYTAWLIVKPTAPLEPQPLPATPSRPIQNVLVSGNMETVYEKLSLEVQQLIQLLNSLNSQDLHGIDVNLHILHECLVHAKGDADMVIGGTELVKRCVEGLQYGLLPEIYIRVLKSLQDSGALGEQWTNQQVTNILIDCRNGLRYNLNTVVTLIRAGLVNLPQYDLFVAQVMDNGIIHSAFVFSIELINMLYIGNYSSQNPMINPFKSIIGLLAKIDALTPQMSECVTNVIKIPREGHHPAVVFEDRVLTGPSVYIYYGITYVRSFKDDDSLELVNSTELILRTWTGIYHSRFYGEHFAKIFSSFFHLIDVCGILRNDDLTTRFLRLLIQSHVESFYTILTQCKGDMEEARPKYYELLNPFVGLIVFLMEHSGDRKINFLNSVLGIVTGCLLEDHEKRKTEFNQHPYHRTLGMLFLELCSSKLLHVINFQVLTAYSYTLHFLRLSKAPGFCYAWLELMGHRLFIDGMLSNRSQQETRDMYAQLLIDIFKDLTPFLRYIELGKTITMYYMGILRVLQVLLHDFPDFLCDYYCGFCNVIPQNCIQMRNIILTACPKLMLLPSPFTANLRTGTLQEMNYSPSILANFTTLVMPSKLKTNLVSYLKECRPATFLLELISNLQISNVSGMRYNIPLMNAIVMYVGMHAITYLQSKGLTPYMSTTAHLDLFLNLVVNLDQQGRYLFLSAMANQLRYPNSHTRYFSCVLLHLFVKTNVEVIKEQITKVLLERVIGAGPHPWGLLVTFIDLIKDPSFNFWDHQFVHSDPEMKAIFESVALSLKVQPPKRDVQE